MLRLQLAEVLFVMLKLSTNKLIQFIFFSVSSYIDDFKEMTGDDEIQVMDNMSERGTIKFEPNNSK